ncbi:hypothetical protein [Streptomyces sp. NPDC013187]|uniref:hypothetical protein n=1 Tax=Streptomyces sp. NPDC013187 TaxID=3364865 RepID=UPI0036780EB7
MIEGVLRHRTDVEIDRQYTDRHGASFGLDMDSHLALVALAFMVPGPRRRSRSAGSSTG